VLVPIGNVKGYNEVTVIVEVCNPPELDPKVDVYFEDGSPAPNKDAADPDPEPDALPSAIQKHWSVFASRLIFFAALGATETVDGLWETVVVIVSDTVATAVLEIVRVSKTVDVLLEVSVIWASVSVAVEVKIVVW
jgi:hypothetical protein